MGQQLQSSMAQSALRCRYRSPDFHRYHRYALPEIFGIHQDRLSPGASPSLTDCAGASTNHPAKGFHEPPPAHSQQPRHRHQRGRTHRAVSAASASDTLSGAERTAAVIEKATGTVDIAPVAASGTTIPQRSTGDAKTAAAPGAVQAPVKARGRVAGFSTGRLAAHRPSCPVAVSVAEAAERRLRALGRWGLPGTGAGGRRSASVEQARGERRRQVDVSYAAAHRVRATVRPEWWLLCCFVLSCGPRHTRTAFPAPAAGSRLAAGAEPGHRAVVSAQGAPAVEGATLARRRVPKGVSPPGATPTHI
ncbi:hypothetical protein FHS40_008560 [Streptomyces spectabilis]|uniref:Uncharacterized protein n=1 Tax=Streptomyces spectabilis TaxID=68270 RepID=A0A7W8B5Y1_STRST|nr:hypothetical protein [Streptomyces spectabilis]